jgi:hypothetical protein
MEVNDQLHASDALTVPKGRAVSFIQVSTMKCPDFIVFSGSKE